MSDPTLEVAAPSGPEYAAAVIGSVPRISIQAFCQDQETAAVIDSASKDRRLGRAHMTVQLGGIVGAAQFFSNAPTPNLLIVESEGPREAVLAELGQIVGLVFSLGIILAVVRHTGRYRLAARIDNLRLGERHVDESNVRVVRWHLVRKECVVAGDTRSRGVQVAVSEPGKRLTVETAYSLRVIERSR